MKCLSIFCVVSKSAITPSFKGRMTRMFSGARPSIALASRPTPITAPSVRRTAMIEGSLRTMPLFRTKTSVLAVPKSIPRSVEKSSSRWSTNIPALLARPLPRAGPWVAVPAEAPAVHREARPGQRGERLGLADGTAVPRADLEPPDGAERERPLHERPQRADRTGEVHVLPAGERRELAPLALRQDDWPPLAEDEPVLRQARRRGPRAVAPNQGEDASPEVRRVHHVDERVRLGATRGRVELAERVGECVLLAREAFHEVAAHDLAAVFHAEQRMAERGPVALGELSRDDAVAREQQPSARLLVVLGRETILLAQHAPAPDHRELAEDAARHPAAAPPRGRRGGGPPRR